MQNMILPDSIEKRLVKWTLASEEIHNLYDSKWNAASEDVYEYSKGDLFEKLRIFKNV